MRSIGLWNGVRATVTSANWSTLQAIQVWAIDDALSEGPHTGVITHSVASTDQSYNGLSVPDLVVSITDNEHYCGEPGQVYYYFDTTGPQGATDCYVNWYDFTPFAVQWMQCTNLFDPACSWSW